MENLRFFHIEIRVTSASNNSYVNNCFENSVIHLFGSAEYIGDVIKHNTFKNSSIFVDYNHGGLDVITENNFFDSLVFVDLSDAPIVDRNYWSNYT